MFSFIENYTFPCGLSLYFPPWISREPKGFPKTRETVLFHKPFGWKKGHAHHSVVSFDSVPATLLLKLVLQSSHDWLLLIGMPLLILIRQSSWWSTLRIQTYNPFLFITYAYMLSCYSKATGVLFWQLGLLALAPYTLPFTLKNLTWKPYISPDLHDELTFEDFVCLFC